MSTALIAVLISLVAVLPLGFVLARRRAGKWPFAALAALVAVVAAASWWQHDKRLGGGAEDHLARHRDNPERTTGDMAAAYERDLAQRGEDASLDELVLLARTQEAARKYEKAAATYARANRRTDFDNPDLLVAEAQARLNAPNAEKGARLARERLEQALALAPEHPGANYYAGSLKVQTGDTQAALPHFERVLESGILEPDAESLLRQRMAEWRGDSDTTIAASTDDATTMEVVVEAGDGAAANGGTLFVFLRRPEGPPMPLAAKRVDAPRFPAHLTIGDADRLQEGRSLASYDRLTVGARLSSSGEATGNPGDPYAQREIHPAAGEALRLRLER